MWSGELGVARVQMTAQFLAVLGHPLGQLRMLAAQRLGQVRALPGRAATDAPLRTGEEDGSSAMCSSRWEMKASRSISPPAAAVDEVLELLRAVGTLRMLQRLQRLGGELFHALLRLVAVGPLELLCLAAQLLLRPRHRPRPEPAVLQRGEQRAAHGAAFDQAVRPVAAQLIVHLSDVLGEIEADAAAGELLVQDDEPVGGGEIHADDGARVDDHGARLRCDGVLNLLLEEGDVREKQAPAEAVEYHAGDGLCLTHAPLRIKARLAGMTPRKSRFGWDARWMTSANDSRTPMMTP